jgi:hypothetical protein
MTVKGISKCFLSPTLKVSNNDKIVGKLRVIGMAKLIQSFSII